MCRSRTPPPREPPMPGLEQRILNRFLLAPGLQHVPPPPRPPAPRLLGVPRYGREGRPQPPMRVKIFVTDTGARIYTFDGRVLHRVQEGEHLDDQGRDRFQARENGAQQMVSLYYDNAHLRTVPLNNWGGIVIIRSNVYPG